MGLKRNLNVFFFFNFKVHLENENNIDGSKFLAEIEEQGLRPNRVTYQHLIALYCSSGDIDKVF